MARRHASTLLLLVLLLLGASACGHDGTQPLTAEQVAKVQPGMGWEDVKAALGNTADRTPERWIFTPSSGPYKKVHITLDQNEEVATVSLTDR